MHLQQHPSHVQKYAAAQYQPDSGPMQQQPEGQQANDSGEQAAPQDSIEPGDDWIEQVIHVAALLTCACLACLC